MARTGETIHFPFQPRPYQLASLKARANGVLRGVCIWPRRHGKDLHGLQLLMQGALTRVGLYNYYFPTFSLAKKIVWKGMDKDGTPFLDYIPKELLKPGSEGKNETDLRLEFTNGSIIQLVGTDNINQNLIGINPIGCLYTEYPVQNPMAWDLTRPILAENGGWAWFLYTPRGRNHGYRLYQIAKEHPESWFLSHLDITQTTLQDGVTPVITPAFIAQEIEQGMDPDLAQQEYYVSFDAPMQGSYYGRLLAQAFLSNRVGCVPYDPALTVLSGWDLGVDDQTAIWYAQLAGEEIRLIDYYEASGEDFFHYFQHTMKKGWKHETVYLPHDAAKTEWGTGKSAEEIAVKAFRNVGVSVVRTPKLDVNESIGVVRRLFPRFRFHDPTTGKMRYRGHSGTDCLASYHKKYNEEKQEYENKPHHNWACMARDTMVLCPSGWRPIQQIQAGEWVITPNGPRRVQWSGVVRSTNDWRTWQGIRATPEHHWFTNRGLVRTDALASQDECWTRGSWGLSCLAWCVWGSRSGFKDAIISATHQSDWQVTRPLPFIAWSIRVCMEACLRSMKSIITMGIAIIPIPPTWKLCLSTSTAANINRPVATPVSASSAGPPSVGINDGPRPVRPSAVVPNMPPSNGIDEPAYDLDIDDAHCYFVRGDDAHAYLVSNSHCASALATLCLGLKDTKGERIQNFYQTQFDPMTYDHVGEYESDFGDDLNGAESLRV